MWSRNRRKLIAEIGGITSIILAGCISESQNNDQGSEPESTSDEGTTDNVEEPIDPKEFTGSGTEVIRDVELGSGLVIAEVEHQSEDEISNIVVTIVEAGGEEERLVFQDRSGRSGKGGNVVTEGNHHVEVDGDGEWSIVLRQPRVSEEEAGELPIESSGSRSDIIGPYLFDGRHVAEITHSGELDVIVTIWPMNGPWSDFEMPILEAGEGTFESTLHYSGIGWVDIQADGDWSLEIE